MVGNSSEYTVIAQSPPRQLRIICQRVLLCVWTESKIRIKYGLQKKIVFDIIGNESSKELANERYTILVCPSS